MPKISQVQQNKMGVAIFLLATVLVLACLMGYALGDLDIFVTSLFMALIVILTVTLWLMLRLDGRANKRRMNEEVPKPAQEAAPKQSVEVLPPAAAREWLDDFLVKQQAEDDLPAGL